MLHGQLSLFKNSLRLVLSMHIRKDLVSGMRVLASKHDKTLTLIDLTKLAMPSHVTSLAALLVQNTSFLVRFFAAFRRVELGAVPIMWSRRLPGTAGGFVTYRLRDGTHS